MKKDIRPDFEELLSEDCSQYRIMCKTFYDLKDYDGDTAYKLMKDSLMIAQRWSDLRASSSKVHALTSEKFVVTDFKNFCYERYRNSQLIHEASRSVYVRVRDELIWCRRNNVDPANVR